jgi:hypothetical protein
MTMRVHVKIDCQVDMYRIRISNPDCATQNWIKLYPSKELCVAELRYLGMLTHIEATNFLRDGVGAHEVKALRNIDAEVDVLKATGFIPRKSRFSQTWRRGNARAVSM